MARAAFLLDPGARRLGAARCGPRGGLCASAPGKVFGHRLSRSQPRLRTSDQPRLAARLRDDHRNPHRHPAAGQIDDPLRRGVRRMVAVSAIVTGLPGGTIEKNRNADLLSPASLVDGTLGNRVTITRTNPGHRGAGGGGCDRAHPRRWRAGAADVRRVRGGALFGPAGEADLRPRARRAFGAAGASASTRAMPRGGTYEVQLTYISWGFDWEAHYVAEPYSARARTTRSGWACAPG